MAGIITEPIAAVSAVVEPDIPEKKTSDTIETMPRPFLKWPTRALDRLTSLTEIPPVSIKEPARMNRGMARKVKESEPEKIICGRITRGRSPFNRRPKIEARPMLKAIGTLMVIKPRNKRLKIIPIYHPTLEQIRFLKESAFSNTQIAPWIPALARMTKLPMFVILLKMGIQSLFILRKRRRWS
jgi:hypothetical protein